MSAETKPGDKKTNEPITSADLDLIGNDGPKEGSGGYSEEDNRQPGPDDEDMLG